MAEAAAPKTEMGYAGFTPPPWTALAGEQSDENVPQLVWPESTRTYHRMRTDAQVDALLKSVFLPIRRRRWVVDPNGARDEIVEKAATDMGLPIAGTGEDPKRGRRRFNHDEHLRHALLSLIYGHMFFEQYGDINDDLEWRLRKLAPRMPQSLSEIKVAKDGGLESIVQHGGGLRWRGVPLPVNRLVAYVWDREGANWAGRSTLRPLYRHWIRKDRLLRIDAMRHEKYGLGIPQGKAPKGGNVAEYGKMAQNIRAGPDMGAGLPEGAELFVEGIRGQLPDIIGSLKYDDEQMARVFLAMFIQLGTTQTGSRALGQTFEDFFTLSLDAIADWYATMTSEHHLEDFVDWNWSVDEGAPALTWEIPEPGPPAVDELQKLVDAGLLTVDDEVRGWVRDRYDLPIAEPELSMSPSGPIPVAARGKVKAHLPAKHNQATHAGEAAVFDGDMVYRSQAAKDDVMGYKVNDYEGINSSLRGGAAPPNQAQVDNIDQAIADTPPLESDMTTVRAFGAMTPETHPEIFTDGAVIQDNGYTSTSMNANAMGEFVSGYGKKPKPGTVVEVRIPAGNRVLDFRKAADGDPFEQEVLLGRGTKFKMSQTSEGGWMAEVQS